MKVEDEEGLLVWFKRVLAPLCDADPECVAKYAAALVKNTDKENLKNELMQQMDVFLTEKTGEFVDMFTSEYLGRNNQSKTNDDEEEDDEKGSQASATNEDSSESEISDDERAHNRAKISRSPSPTPTPQTRYQTQTYRRDNYSRGNRRAGGRRARVHDRLYSQQQTRGGNNRYPPMHDSSPRSRRRYSRSQSPPHNDRYRDRSRSPIQREHNSRRSSLPRELTNNNIQLTQPSISQTNHVVKPQGCRDYIEKGLCMKGENCEYSHADYLPMSSQLTPLVGSLTNSVQNIIPVNNTTSNVIPTNTVQPVIRPVRPQLPQPGKHTEPYNPEMPRMWRPRGPQSQPTINPQPQRPINPRQTMRPGQSVMPHRRPHPYNPRHRMMGPGMAGGPRQVGPRPSFQRPLNTTLEIQNLPEMPNMLNKLAEHFGKFGNVTEVKVPTPSDRSAYVTYDNYQAARAAHSDPKPLFNNRFVKIFFHNPNNLQQLQQPNQQHAQPSHPLSMPIRGNVKQRLGSNIQHPTPVAPPQIPVPSEPNMNPATLRLDNKPRPAIVRPVRPVVPTTNNSTIQNQKVLLKRKQELIAYQKTILVKVSQTIDAAKKQEFIRLAKNAADKIQKLEEEMKNKKSLTVTTSMKPVAQTPGVKVKSPENDKLQKSLLDTQLEVHQLEQAGENTEELKNKLDLLKKQAEARGLMPSRGRGRGRGGFVQSQHAAPEIEEPTAISILNVAEEERQALVKHFCAYGKAEELSYTPGKMNTMVINFDTSHNAKVAASHGVKYKDGNLIMKWYKPPVVPVETEQSADDLLLSAGQTADQSETTTADDDVDQELEDLLLAGDDDEDEKRLW